MSNNGIKSASSSSSGGGGGGGGGNNPRTATQATTTTNGRNVNVNVSGGVVVVGNVNCSSSSSAKSINNQYRNECNSKTNTTTTTTATSISATTTTTILPIKTNTTANATHRRDNSSFGLQQQQQQHKQQHQTTTTTTTTASDTRHQYIYLPPQILPTATTTTTNDAIDNGDNAMLLVYTNQTLISGTLDALITHMVPTADYYPDRTYIFAFLLSARLFIRPHELLAQISQTWELQQQQQQQQQAAADVVDDAGSSHSSATTAAPLPLALTAISASPLQQRKAQGCIGSVSMATIDLSEQRLQRTATQKSAQHCVRLLSEWIETFPYDFRDERLMQQVRILARKCVYIDNSLGKQVSRILQLLVQRLTALEQYEQFLQTLQANEQQQQQQQQQQNQHQQQSGGGGGGGSGSGSSSTSSNHSDHQHHHHHHFNLNLHMHNSLSKNVAAAFNHADCHKGNAHHYNSNSSSSSNNNNNNSSNHHSGHNNANSTSSSYSIANSQQQQQQQQQQQHQHSKSIGNETSITTTTGGGNDSVSCDMPVDIIDLCPSCAQLAHQLTAIELERLSHIGPEEFVQAFAKEYTTTTTTAASSSSAATSKTMGMGTSASANASTLNDMKKTRNLESYVEWFNRLSYFTASEIVKYPKKKQRVRIIEYWVETARECFNIGNFNSLMAIIAGLNLAPIARLKKTWSKVQLAKFSVLEHQMDPTSNFNSYRSTLKAAMWRSEGATDARERIIIPFFSLFVKDLYFLNEGCSNRLPNNHINFEKCSQLAKQIIEFNEWKKVACPFEQLPNVIAFLQNSPVLNENTLSMASFECEPPENTEEKGRYKTVKAETKQQLLQQLQEQQQQQQQQ